MEKDQSDQENVQNNKQSKRSRLGMSDRTQSVEIKPPSWEVHLRVKPKWGEDIYCYYEGYDWKKINKATDDKIYIDDKLIKSVFQFKSVVREAQKQKSAFQRILAAHIPNFLKGYNVTTIAYGQTGTGKSHTLFGEPGSINLHKNDMNASKNYSSDESEGAVRDEFPYHYGLMQRTYITLFRALQGSKSIMTISALQCADKTFKQSMDLLGNHMVYTDQVDSTYFIGLSEITINSEEELFDILCTIETLKNREPCTQDDAIQANNNLIVTLKCYKKYEVIEEY